MEKRILRGVGFAFTFITAMTPAAVSAEPPLVVGEDRFRFDLPAQSLAEAIQQVAATSGRNILVSDALVRNRVTAPLSGTFSTEAVLERLLEGSGLRVRKVGTDLIVTTAGGAGSKAEQTPVGDDTIVVTGSHVRGAAPSSPVLVLNRADIDRTGATSADELMRTVLQNSQGGVNKENALVVLPDQNPTDHGAGVNLRGLGQRATLVLLDGRRLAPGGDGSFVDISMIPLSAVERVDILTDGASAIYGSDAVGGVVNFVLRERFDGLEVSAQSGLATRGGGSQYMVSEAAGRSWTGGRILVAHEFRAGNEIRAGQRSITANLQPQAFILPRERKHGVIATLDQNLTPDLSAGATATFAHRTTRRTTFLTTSSLPVGVAARSRSLTLAGHLSWALPSSWLLRLDGNVADQRTDQRQTQPGGIALVNSRDVRSRVGGVELRLDGPLADIPGGPVRLALGGEYRSERYRDGFESSSFPRTVAAARRRVTSLYGELAVPLVSALNRRPGLEALQLSAAARYDRYSSTGSSFDPKVGLLWSPFNGVALRAAYSTSFRAPLLSEVSGVYSGIYLPARFFYADPAAAPAGTLALFLQGSNPAVTPERSRNWTAGLEWKPPKARGAALTINYYAIRYTDRIALPTSSVRVIGNPAFASIVDFDPDLTALAALVARAQTISDFSGPGFTAGGATPADVDVVLDDRVNNSAYTATSGLDVGLRYPFTVGRNAVVIDAAVTHIFRFRQKLTPQSPALELVDTVYRPLRWRARAGVTWSRGGWAGGLTASYAGSYRDNRTSIVRRVGEFTTVDGQLSHTFGDGAPGWARGLSISLYANNLFNASPPLLAPDPGSGSALRYDPVNASARGRFIAIQLKQRW